MEHRSRSARCRRATQSNRAYVVRQTLRGLGADAAKRSDAVHLPAHRVGVSTTRRGGERSRHSDAEPPGTVCGPAGSGECT